MKTIVLMLGIAVIFVAITQIFNSLKIFRLRQAGVYPFAGEATMSDVERLNQLGMQVLAIRCYHEIYRCSLRQTKDAVANIRTEIKPND